jgi:hypothetical protein
MPRKRKRSNPDDPKPLNFDHDRVKGLGDRMKKPFMTPDDSRGDNRDDQYYDTEEALSPEETKIRKEEGTL